MHRCNFWQATLQKQCKTTTAHYTQSVQLIYPAKHRYSVPPYPFHKVLELFPQTKSSIMFVEKVVIRYYLRCDEVRIRQRSKFKRFQQIRNLTNVLNTLLSNANSCKNPCSTTDLICTERQSAQTNLIFFLKFNIQLLNVQHNFCSVMCYTVLI